MEPHNHLSLITLLMILLPTLSLAWICYPPVHLLPDEIDCVGLIVGLHFLARLPSELPAKRWGRGLPNTPSTEQLPRWYYTEDGGRPATTCGVVVDAIENEPAAVATFRLENVADAARTVFSQCVDRRKQVGLEFPSEDVGTVVLKMMRLDGIPTRLIKGAGGGMEGGEGRVRRVVLPEGRGTLYVADKLPESFNVSATM